MMKRLGHLIWNVEPVTFVTAVSTTWAAVVTFDEVSDDFAIPVFVYVAAVIVTVFLGAITRTRVTPADHIES